MASRLTQRLQNLIFLVLKSFGELQGPFCTALSVEGYCAAAFLMLLPAAIAFITVIMKYYYYYYYYFCIQPLLLVAFLLSY